MMTSEQTHSEDIKIQDSNGQGFNANPNEGSVNEKELTPEFIEETRKILDIKLDQLQAIAEQLFSKFNICAPNRNDMFVNVNKNMMEGKAVAKAQEREKIALVKAFELNKEGIEELSLGNYEDALAKFRAAININPKDKVFQANQAQALFHLGKNQDSLESVKLSLDIDQNYQPSQDLKEKIEIKIKEAEKIAAAEERAQKIAEIRAQNKAESDKISLEYSQKKEQLKMEKKKLEYQKPIITTYLMNDQKIQGLSNSFIDENTNEEIKFVGESLIKTEKIAEAEL